MNNNFDFKEIASKLNTDNALSIFQDLLGFAPRNKQLVRLFDTTKTSSERFRDVKGEYPARIHNYKTYEHYTAVEAYMKWHGLEDNGQGWKQAIIELGKDYGYLPYNYDKKPHEKRKSTPPAQPTEAEREKANCMVNPKIGEWTPKYLDFWTKFGITQEWLNRYEILPLLSFDFVNIETGKLACTKRLDEDEELAYAYRAGKDCVKKYQPKHPNKNFKWGWIGETTQKSIIWGIAQLPEKCAKIVIVEGLKDALALNVKFSEEGIWAVGLDSASQYINDNDLATLRSKVNSPNDVFLCLDNDETGKKQNALKAQKYGLAYLPYPEDFASAKDMALLCERFEKFVIKDWLLNGKRENTEAESQADDFSGTKEPEGTEKAPKVKKTTPKKAKSDNGTPKKSIQRLEDYLSANYDFRYNTVKNQLEIKKRTENDYKFKTKIMLNSIVRDIKHNTSFKKIGKETVENALLSDFSPSFNPLHSYFENLPAITGKKYIEALAQTLTVENGKEVYFLKCFTKWLVASVANVFNEQKCENHTCLVLTGTQGTAKTTWLDNLCPPTLNKYLFTGRIVIKEDNDNVLRLMNSFFLINIDDQLKNLNHKDENALKTLISLPKCNYKRLYEDVMEDLPRNASFMASVNGYDFLTDATGSRRFLSFEAMAIDREALKNINVDLAWAEAYTLYKSGVFQWWFDRTEINELEESNQNFTSQSTESELLSLYYSPIPLYENQKSLCLQTTEVLLNLQTFAEVKNLNYNALGKALKSKGFFCKNTKVNKLIRQRYTLYPNIDCVDTETGELNEYAENFKN